MFDFELEKSDKHIKRAWIAGTISASFTLLFSFLGAIFENFRIKYGFDTWSLIDFALATGLTFGIYRKNRFCALGMLIFYIFGRFCIAAQTGKFAGAFISLIFAYFFFMGTIAAFKIHKYKIREETFTDKKRGCLFYLIIAFLVVFGLCVACFIVIAVYAPENEAIPGKLLKKKYYDFVREKELINSDEIIEYWYCDALFNIKDGAYFFTNKKVVLYCDEWEKPALFIPFDTITDIQIVYSSSFFDNSQITILMKDETSVNFSVSKEYGGDKKFYNKMIRVWKNNKKENYRILKENNL